MKLTIQDVYRFADERVRNTKRNLSATRTYLHLLSEKQQRCGVTLGRSQQISELKVRLFFMEKRLKDEQRLDQLASSLLFELESLGLANVQQSACDYAARLARDGFRLQWDTCKRQINIVCFSFSRLSALYL